MPSSPESRRFSFGGLSEALDLVIAWVEALHGQGDAAGALQLMLRLVNGRRASLVRLRLDTAIEAVLEKVTANPEEAPGGPGISFPQYLLGHGLGQAQAGSVWYVSELAREISADERTGVRLGVPDRRTREIAAIVLEPRRLTSDILELHFPARLSARDAEALSMLAGVLSRGWRRRGAGVFPLEPEQGRTSDAARAEAILSAGNPAGLSKSEYRVCELVSRGLGAKAISGRLLISESTVRSHLRSIYAKTGTSGQRELICRLLGPAGPHDARAAEPRSLAAPAPERAIHAPGMGGPDEA
jgi:DNA-binding CsgD family transcriptional regulator